MWRKLYKHNRIRTPYTTERTDDLFPQDDRARRHGTRIRICRRAPAPKNNQTHHKRKKEEKNHIHLNDCFLERITHPDGCEIFRCGRMTSQSRSAPQHKGTSFSVPGVCEGRTPAWFRPMVNGVRSMGTIHAENQSATLMKRVVETSGDADQLLASPIHCKINKWRKTRNTENILKACCVLKRLLI